jgi:hypothetical protein
MKYSTNLSISLDRSNKTLSDLSLGIILKPLNFLSSEEGLTRIGAKSSFVSEGDILHGIDAARTNNFASAA